VQEISGSPLNPVGQMHTGRSDPDLGKKYINLKNKFGVVTLFCPH